MTFRNRKRRIPQRRDRSHRRHRSRRHPGRIGRSGAEGDGEEEMTANTLERDGYILLRGVYGEKEIDGIRIQLIAALARDSTEAVRRSEQGHVFAARNVLAIWPSAAEVWRQPACVDVLREVLGLNFGLVRGLYFDKPPEHTWTLPIHKDMTIAVRDNRLPSKYFSKPTTKIGVPHVEAPVSILERMLTLRIHLDAATSDNGALQVISGSHRTGKELSSNNAKATPVLAAAGDVLAIRPLVSHCSGKSTDGTKQHRRILHLEFAADRTLPDDYEWYQLFPA